MPKPKSMDTPAFGIKPLLSAEKELGKHKYVGCDG